MLIDALPQESAFIRDGEMWLDSDHFAATLLEVVTGALGKKLEIPRPGVEQTKPESTSDPNEIASWFGKNMI